jgi:diguanylate cyclase (GGDEF)-like protein/PAS domain S-box-containing protein
VRRAVEAAGGFVLITDAKRHITWCNAAFTALCGYTLAEARGHSPGELLQFDGTDGDTVVAMRRALDAGQGFEGRLRNRAKDGREYWTQLNIQPLRDADGALESFVAMGMDVTAETREQDYLRSVAGSATSGLVVEDDQGVIIDANPEAERLFELPAAQFVGQSAADPRWRLVHGDGSALLPHESPSARALAQGRTVRGQIVGLTLSGGRRRWLEVGSQRIPGRSEGRFAVVSSFVDVSAQFAAHVELAAERRRLATAIDGAHAGVWEWDLFSGAGIVNERWAQICGLTLAELVPMHIDRWTALVHADDLPRLQAALCAHDAGTDNYFDIECRVQHRQGHWVWVALRGRIAERDAAGRARTMSGTLIDINAAKAGQHALEAANRQLQALFDLAPMGMTLSRLEDGVFLRFNNALVELLGHGRDRLEAICHRDLLPPSRRALARSHREQLLRDGRFGPSETELLHADGRAVPVLLSGMRVRMPDGTDVIWSIMQDLSRIKRMERRLRSEARIDRLTCLPNRTWLTEQLEQCVAHAAADPTQGFALLFLDIDRFKLVNDTQGHDAGDQLLQIVADRLARALRAADTRGDGVSLVARLGGDEFVILLAEVRTAQAAAQVARRLLDVLATPCQVAQKEIHPSASIGIVLGGADSGSASAVLRNADMAMYEAKRAGRGKFAFFDPGMLAQLSRTVLVESALRRAIALQQLHVVYQPIVDLATGAMVSVEALVRWQHPELGGVSPGEFIPIAEESGLIVPIGEWVLRQACAQWRQWQQQDPGAAPPTVSVNLSRVQMGLGELLLALVANVLAEQQMPPGALQLEVTEREVMRDPAAARKLMEGLRCLGVKLAMDDFGTGASSLGCLRDYPFDVIKIDKSFIDDIDTSPAMLAVLHGTVAVIENLGMSSVAEGVEQAVQVGVLQSLGCRFGQGYLFSRPVPGDRLLAAMGLEVLDT